MCRTVRKAEDRLKDGRLTAPVQSDERRDRTRKVEGHLFNALEVLECELCVAHVRGSQLTRSVTRAYESLLDLFGAVFSWRCATLALQPLPAARPPGAR